MKPGPTSGTPHAGRVATVVALAAALALGAGAVHQRSHAQTASAPAELPTAKGALEDPYGEAQRAKGGVATPKAKSYSPYAGRSYPTQVYFGATHHHTANSGDAFATGNRLGREDAYRLARGEEVVTSTGIAARMGGLSTSW